MSIFAIAAILVGLSALFGYINHRLLRWQTFTRGAVPVLIWGGLRGGIAVALALSLPEIEYKAAILGITYVVVLFSIVVEGLTIKPLVKRMIR